MFYVVSASFEDAYHVDCIKEDSNCNELLWWSSIIPHAMNKICPSYEERELSGVS